MFEVGLISFLLAVGLSLPLPPFFSHFGHHCSAFVTVTSLFLSPWASLRRFRYRCLSFSPSSGIITALSLPLPLFFALLGHHCGAFVTVTSLFLSPWASLRRFRYRYLSFSLSSDIIAALSLPLPLFFSHLGHHCYALATPCSLFLPPLAS
ncbi:hypothetical protein ACTHO5_04870 [Cytobacillus praedii]|uniref:hypothetical protein n=1 Tax=Cytobacillus praedii TaxID=1742358 RepID=UPI003F7EA8E1